MRCGGSVMNIFCMEEPLWLRLALKEYAGSSLRYHGSWRQTLVSR